MKRAAGLSGHHSQLIRGAEEEEIKEVVITGSRIARRDYVSQSPIVTVGAQTFEERSTIGIESALNQLLSPQSPGG
jgi:hypothetical protein